MEARRCGPLAFEEALPLFREIAEALEAAHGKGWGRRAPNGALLLGFFCL